MNIFVKKIKNVFAKKVFLPIFFVAIFIFSLSLVSINTFSKNTQNNNSYSSSQVNNSEKSQSDNTYLNSKENGTLSSNNLQQNSNTLQQTNESVLPEEYTLISVDMVINNFLMENKANTANLPSNVGAQMGTSICWAFASLTAFETSLYKQGVVNKNQTLNFSELNLAYTTQVINRALQNIAGGNFDLAYEFLSSENGVAYEQNGEGCTRANESRWANDISATSYYASEFYNSANETTYRALEAKSFPNKSLLTETEDKQNLRTSIKNHILNYGGVTASIYMDSQNLVNNQYYICTNKNLKQNHMITLIGWDDNFTQHVGGTTYTGAYIAQNSSGTSWGTDGYFYIMYDDAFVENDVNGFLRVGEELENYISYNNMSETSFNNKFLTFKTNSSGAGETSYNIKTISEPFFITNIYKTQNVSSQYISRIKIPTSYNNKQTQFRVYFLNGITENDVMHLNAINNFYKSNFANATKVKNKYATDDEYIFTSNQATYYTIELSENTYVTNNYFAIVVEYLSGSVPQLNNDDSTLSSPYLFTYKSQDALDWSSYYTADNSSFSILPMIVQMQYDLGNIEYSKENITKTYDGENANINISVTTDCNHQIYYSLTGEENDFSITKPQIKDSGNYTIYFKIKAEFYNVVEDYLTINIGKKDITVTPVSNQSKIYGEGDQILSYNYEGSFEPAFIRGRLSREIGEDVNSYQILLGSLELYSSQNFNKNNYNLVFSSTKIYFNITPRELIVIPNLTSKIYGDADPEEITYTYKNLAIGEIPAFNGVLSRESGENAGKFTIVLNTLALTNNMAQISTQKNFYASNYTLSLQENENKFVIEKRNLIVTPNPNQSKIYGEEDGKILYTYSNNVAGETPSFSGVLSREEGESAGRYAYLIGSLELQSTGTFSKTNYTLVLNAEDNFYTISYGLLNGCVVPDVEETYNGSYYYVTPTNTIHTDVSYEFSLDGITWQVNTIKIKDAGTHNVYVKFSKDNYADNIIVSTIKINALNLVVTPNSNQSKIYGEIDNLISYTYTGNLPDETPLFVGELSREIDTFNYINERVGEYQINKGNLSLQDNNNFIASNYNLVFNLENAKFSITPRQLNILPLANQSKYYNMLDGVISFTYSNNVFGETPLFTGVLGREEGENIGIYEINIGSLQGKQNDNFLPDNYQIAIQNNVTYQIKPAQITIKINNKQSYYGQEIDNNFTYMVINNSVDTGSYKEGEDLNLTFTCPVTANSLKGSYVITCSSNNPNYSVTVQNGIYQVLYNNYTVQFTAYNQPISFITVEHFYTLKDSDFPQLPYKSGYKFNCWLVLSSNGSFSVVSSGYTITSYTTIVAMVETINYSITYVTNGGTFNPVITTYNIETPNFVINAPVKQGYTFDGWYTNPNLLGESVTTIPKGSTGDKTLYAKYTINSYKISFENGSDLPYSFYYEGSTTVKYSSNFKFSVILKQEYNRSYSKMKVYAKLEDSTNNDQNEDIILVNKDSNGSYVLQNVLGNYKIYCEDITLNSYNIFFMIDNNLVKQVKKNHGESLNDYEYPQIPTKNHYNNTAPYWDKPFIESVTNDEVINAKYVPDVHVVTFILPDGKVVKTNVNYGENASTKELENEYKLGLLNYYVFETSIDNITQDTIVRVKIGSNAYILYIVIALVVIFIAVIVAVTLIKKRKKDTFNWWVYTKRK